MPKLIPDRQEATWGRMIWLCHDQNAVNPDMSLARMEVDIGQTSDSHRHGNCHEVLHVLNGHIIQIVDGIKTEMVPGDTLFIPKGHSHYTMNTGSERAVLMISYSEEKRDYEPAEGS